MKRFFALVCVLALSLVALSGCEVSAAKGADDSGVSAARQKHVHAPSTALDRGRIVACEDEDRALNSRRITLEACYDTKLLGLYLPQNIPERFSFDSATLYTGAGGEALSAVWADGYDSLELGIRRVTQEDRARVVSLEEREHYDLSLYPIPRADSVPESLRTVVDDPIFVASDLTLEAVRARAERVTESGDSPGWRMSFGVLFDDEVLAHVTAKGVTPEQLYDMLCAVAAGTHGSITGRCLVSTNGSYLIVDGSGSPIVLQNLTGDDTLFADLHSGDLIEISCNGIEETYPGKTGVYRCERTARGSMADIPEIVLQGLQELGWSFQEN